METIEEGKGVTQEDLKAVFGRAEAKEKGSFFLCQHLKWSEQHIGKDATLVDMDFCETLGQDEGCNLIKNCHPYNFQKEQQEVKT